MPDQFRQWLTSEMDKRRFSQTTLAKAMGISQSFVSRVLSGEKSPSVDFCNRVALAFGESPEKALRLAGILPTSPASDDPTIEEIQDLVKNLPPSQRKDVLRYIRFLYQNDKEE